MILRKRKLKLCMVLIVFIFLLFVVILSFIENLSVENKNLNTESDVTEFVQYTLHHRTTHTVTNKNKANHDDKMKIQQSTVAPIDWLTRFRLANLTDAPQITKADTILLLDGIEWWKESLKSFKNCPISCEFIGESNSESQYSSSYKAIVIVRDMFHSSAIEESDLQNPNTKLIYYSLEAPQSSYGLEITGNAMLASYWRGSDFWTPYIKWKTTRSKNNNSELNKTLRKTTKNRKAVAVISNCVTRNDREWLIADLNRYIQVDVFGKCGNDSCDRSSSSTCFAEIKKMYKFYLAFENTNCRDYITEKYFRSILELDMIPVVMGAPRIDYETLVPKNSYIHFDDFQSLQNLAEYLILLDNNDTAFNEYFRWKHESSGHVEQTNFLCEVCAMVKMSNSVPVRSRLPDGFQWAFENSDLCLPSGQWNWNK